MAAGGQANANAEQEFMWRYVISDIFKDHPSGYQPVVIRGLLPYFPLDSSPDTYKSNKENLLDSLITLHEGGRTLQTGIYDDLQRLPHLANGGIELKLFNTNCRYIFTVFDNREGVHTADSVNMIKAATLNGRPDTTGIILTTDTSVRTDAILNLWTSPINAKFSRESVWDPAPRSERNKCVETSPPNPTSVLYPKFEGNLEDKLSYLFLNYDVYLGYNNNRVCLEYRKDGELKRVNGDANTAGLVISVVEKTIRCFKSDAATLNKIEDRYIGKYSGDGCLRISQFRNTILNPPCNQPTFNYDMQLNETCDGIYLPGLLAAQSDAIWFHTNDKKRLIVFSKVINQGEYLQAKYAKLLTYVRQNLEVFSSVEANYRAKLGSVAEILARFMNYRFAEPLSFYKYIQVLKEFTKYSILYDKFLIIQRKFNEMTAKYRELNNATNNVIVTIRNLNTPAENGEIIEEMSVENKIKLLEKVQSAINPYLRINTDISWALTLFTGGKLQDVTIEELVIKKMASSHRVGWKVTYESVFNAINPSIDSSVKQRVSRFFMSKTLSAWGLDIINKVYEILQGISFPVDEGGGGGASAPAPEPRHLHTEFITKLRNTLDTTLQTEFDLRVNAIGIPTPQPTPQIGGKYIHKKTYKSKKRVRKTTKVYKQRGGAFTPASFRTELQSHLDFITNFVDIDEPEDGEIMNSTNVKNMFNTTFSYLESDEPTKIRGRRPQRTSSEIIDDRNRSRSRKRGDKQKGFNQEGFKQEGGATNVYEYNMDFLEIYKHILGENHPSIIRLLNRYSIMNYVNKNSLSHIEKSIEKIKIEDMPDAENDSNDSIVKMLTKQVATDAILKVKASVLAIREMCKSDIMSHPEYTRIIDAIDVHLGEAYTFLKVAEVAYDAGGEYRSSRYDKAIQYLQEVLALYPVSAATEDMPTSGNSGSGGGASPPREPRETFSSVLSPQRKPVAARVFASPAATQSQESGLESQALSQLFSPVFSPIRRVSDEAEAQRVVHAAASKLAGSVTLKSLLEKLNVAMGDIKQISQVPTNESMEASPTNESMEAPAPKNNRPVSRRMSTDGPSARRLFFNESPNSRKTQRKPRR